MSQISGERGNRSDVDRQRANNSRPGVLLNPILLRVLKARRQQAAGPTVISSKSR
jgi:hypothetical protein